jgi:hypothetical protein
MWCQEMLPSILHGCRCDTISSFSIKNVVPDIFDQTLYLSPGKAASLHLRAKSDCLRCPYTTEYDAQNFWRSGDLTRSLADMAPDLNLPDFFLWSVGPTEGKGQHEQALHH